MIKAIIFDCFGVIKQDSFAPAYTFFGGDVEKDEEWAAGVFDLANTAKIPSTAPLFAERLGITAEQWRQKSKELDRVNEDVITYVDELRKKYKTALLTNIGQGGTERHFLPNFLEKHFDVVFASGDEGIAKPEARAYEITAERLGVRLDECVFIDDRQRFIDGAIAVGMPAFLYTGLDELKEDLSSIGI